MEYLLFWCCVIVWLFVAYFGWKGGLTWLGVGLYGVLVMAVFLS